MPVHVPVGPQTFDEPTPIRGAKRPQRAEVRARSASMTHCQPSPRASAAATLRALHVTRTARCRARSPCRSSSRNRGQQFGAGARARGNRPRRDSASMRPR